MDIEQQSFDRSFEVFLADTVESKKLNYKIRYKVYCEEMCFENKEFFPDQMECDEWDAYSDHFLVRHRYSGEWIGAMRLVRQKDSIFPFQEKCLLDEGIREEQHVEHSVELSRLCVVKEARRFAMPKLVSNSLANAKMPQENNNVTNLNDLKINSRTIMWGLYRAAAVYLKNNNIDYVYTLATQALVSYARKEGFELRKVGSTCEHKGTRTPYQFNIDNVLANPIWLNDYKQGFRLYSKWENQVAFELKFGS